LRLRRRAAAARRRSHFDDLRGTAVARVALAGCSVEEIAAITGHSLKTVREIVDRHDLGGHANLADQAIAKLEAGTKTRICQLGRKKVTSSRSTKSWLSH